MKKIPKITVPLAPLVLKGEKEPIESKRLRPGDVLNLDEMLKELKRSTIKTLEISENSWSIIPVLSPYSRDFHVMLMETSGDRYLPSMEYIGEVEGNLLMEVWIEIIKYMKAGGDNVYFGYNWSPWSWGVEEEKTGFQSIPTKWHGMFWTWPNFDNNQENFLDADNDNESIAINFISEKDVPATFKRLNGDSYFSHDIVKDFQVAIDEIKNNHSDFRVSSGISKLSDGAYIIKFDCSLESLLSSEKIFSTFLKPIAKYLNSYFAELTDLFFKKDWCKLADDILKKTSEGMISEIEYDFLQSFVDLKDDDEIGDLLIEKSFSFKSIIELLAMVKNRRNGDYLNGWRKGFAYAFTLKEENSITELKITPGTYLGPAGAVESLGVVLERPEDETLTIDELIMKSNELYEFGDNFPISTLNN